MHYSKFNSSSSEEEEPKRKRLKRKFPTNTSEKNMNGLFDELAVTDHQLIEQSNEIFVKEETEIIDQIVLPAVEYVDLQNTMALEIESHLNEKYRKNIGKEEDTSELQNTMALGIESHLSQKYRKNSEKEEDTFEDTNEELKSVKNTLTCINDNVNDIKNRVSRVESKLDRIFDMVQAIISKMATTSYEIRVDELFRMPSLPILSSNSVSAFNEQLLDVVFLDQVAIRLKDMISTSVSVNKSVKVIMERLISYETLILHSWSGKSGIHLNFEDTKLPFNTYEGIFELLFRTINLVQRQSREDIKKGLIEFLKRATQNHARIQKK